MTLRRFLLFSLAVRLLTFISPTFAGIMSSTLEEVSGHYEPLFLLKNDKTYEFADNITYDPEETLYSISPPDNHDLYYACEALDLPESEKYPDALEAEVVDDPPINLSEIRCADEVQPITWKINTKGLNMPKNVSQYKIGFLIYNKDGTFPRQTGFEGLPKQYHMLPVLSINVDTELPRVISVSHTIYAGHLLQVNPTEPRDIIFESNSNIFGIDTDEIYSPQKQGEGFRRLFGRYHYMYASSGDNAFKKVQLASMHDFVLPNLAKTTLFNLNTAPLWNRLWYQWNMMEIFVRKVAKILKKLIVGTGTAEILKLSKFDNNGDQTNDFIPIYLSVNEQKTISKFPVPKYFYKSITYTEYDQSGNVLGNKGILIILLNSLYTETENTEPICQDICSKLGWTVANKYITTGLMYCCTLNRANMMNLGIYLQTNYDEFNLHEMKSPKNNNVSIYEEIQTEYSVKTMARNLSRKLSRNASMTAVKQMVGL